MSDYTASEQRGIELAGPALSAACRHDWSKATELIQQISDEAGEEGLYIALLGWCDAYATEAGVKEDSIVKIGFMAVETGETGTADEVPTDVAWAGRLIAARAALDADNFNALLGALPDDGDEVGRHVWRVLEMCALGIRRLRFRDAPTREDVRDDQHKGDNQ